jgi:pimeloyl-ACP methyl ester carboxylesterase
MDERRVAANGIEIAYQTFGDRGERPLVLVMGLGTQLLGWPEPLCRQLADQGFFVVRFDNRDIGQSTHLDALGVPNLPAVALRRQPPAYTIDDMAADTIGLFDALELGPVHLVGASMGGFIAQTVALRVPGRVASLTLMMTSTGSRLVGGATPPVLAQVMRRRVASTREAAVEGTVAILRMIGSGGYEFDDAYIRELAGQSYERGYDPDGNQRQLAAIVAQPNRTRRLAQLTVPTVVMHGLQDPLVAASGGMALARAIPRARFVGFNGMGHGLPRELWPQFVAEIVAVASRG